MLRYLLLLFHGGIYSDTDTTLLKPPSLWGAHPTLLETNPPWLTPVQASALKIAPDSDILDPPSLVIGIEADVDHRPDWHDWWPRPIQFCQWTIGSAPGHPVMLMTLGRILRGMAKAVDWAGEHQVHLGHLRELSQWGAVEGLERVTVVDEPVMGGPLGVMEWTGPGAFTDSGMR